MHIIIFKCLFLNFTISGTQGNSVTLFSLFDKRNESNFDPLIISKFNKIYACFNDCLIVQYSDDLGEKGINWIKSVFVNKLVKMILYNKSNIVNGLNFSNLINILNYYKLYERLKLKYAKDLIEVKDMCFINIIKYNLFLMENSFTELV